LHSQGPQRQLNSPALAHDLHLLKHQLHCAILQIRWVLVFTQDAQVFSDKKIYAMEQEKIFRRRAWHYLCMASEVRKPRDIKTTWLGDTPIIVTRDENDAVHAMINRCGHKGALECDMLPITNIVASREKALH
jgi:phenylpropionate dioxygenase-like ring-hydroxylating dioxygenase large terminal subunit